MPNPTLSVLTQFPSSQEPGNVMQINRANLAMDGMAIMEPRPHFDWYCRAMLLVNRYLLRQLPISYDVEVDTEAFLKSMSFKLNDTRVGASPWALAPPNSVHRLADQGVTGMFNMLWIGLTIDGLFRSRCDVRPRTSRT